MTVTAGHSTTGRTPSAPLPAAASQITRAPRLTDGIELVGEYQDSGYRQPPSLLRRPDGQVIQTPYAMAAVDAVGFACW